MVLARAKIQVNADQVASDTINPYIFGHFVEDIRDHMDAMLAYPLKDMDFESVDGTYRGFPAAGVLIQMEKAPYMLLSLLPSIIRVIVSWYECIAMIMVTQE